MGYRGHVGSAESRGGAPALARFLVTLSLCEEGGPIRSERCWGGFQGISCGSVGCRVERLPRDAIFRPGAAAGAVSLYTSILRSGIIYPVSVHLARATVRGVA